MVYFSVFIPVWKYFHGDEREPRQRRDIQAHSAAAATDGLGSRVVGREYCKSLLLMLYIVNIRQS